MTPGEYRELSRLWKEQVDPSREQAALRALAEEIQRTAMRRRMVGLGGAYLGIGVCGTLLLVKSMPMPMPLILGVMIAFMMWWMWKERQFLKATRALADCPPRSFPKAAMERMRVELRLLTICLWLAVPAGIFVLVLLIASRESIGLGAALLALTDTYWRKLAAYLVTVFVVQVYFIRDQRQLRQQLRRLEAMSRELETEDLRDRAEEA
jgi:hypothetical protein